MATIDELTKVRLEKLVALRKMGVDPYPSVVKRDHTILQALQMDGSKVAIVGRIMGLRGHGKIFFIDLFDGSGKIQAVIKTDTCSPDDFKIIELLDLADFIAVQGLVGKTQAGEVSVFVENLQILTKAIRPLPDKWYGLKDVEERFRKRYLDILLNDEVRSRMIARSRIIDAIADFLTDRGYLQVETPTLQPVYGGGFARPFSTHHNSLDTNFYLRISDEMYLKRLIVAGIEKVFEITKVFRNEGVDHDHNPEFTMFEAQIAYEDYSFGMNLIEEIIEHVALSVFGKTKFSYQGVELNFGRPWTRYKVVEAIKQFTGVNPLAWKSVDDAKEAIQKIEGIAEDKFVELKKMRTVGECIAFVFEEVVEEKLIQPTIIYDYPVEISPLAKKCDDPRYTQRFEMFAFGSELGNNYTELNDPIDLKQRFIEEKKREESGFDEAHQTDYDYLEAIEHGFPPTCGIAIGIDRLVMLLTDAKSIKEVIPFPTLRPEKQVKKMDKYDYREKKIIVVVDEALEKGKMSNALGHIAFSAGRYLDNSWMGQEILFDADGVTHRGIAKYPFIVLSASQDQLKNIVEKARLKSIFSVEFPMEMLETGNDEALVKAVSKLKKNFAVYQAVLLAGKTYELADFTVGLPLY